MHWLLALFLILASCEKEAPPETIRPVKAIQVSESTASENQLIFPGTLRAFKRADLSFRVDGTVIVRDIFVGFEAKKDETLMRLDPREYEIALNKAQGKVESTQAQLDFAIRDYDRMKKIYEKDPGAISMSLLDRKKENANQLKGELTIAKSELDQATDNLAYTKLKAPFDGIIAALYVENHEQVRAKQPVLRFLDTAQREMEINVPEKYMNFLIEHQGRLNFELNLDAFPDQVFHATIKEIGTEASSTTQTYPVTLALQHSPEEFSLLAGMSGRAVLKLAPKKSRQIFVIPKSALFTDDVHNNYVWIVDPKAQTVHKKSIKIDEKSRGDQVIVKEGLAPGDWIVTAGTSFLNEGQRVKLVVEQPKQ